MRSLGSFLIGIALLASAHDARAQAPELLSYQGVLTLSNGTVVVDGLYGIRFSVYDAPSSGTLRFEQTLQVMVKDGLYNVMLSSQAGWSLKDAFAGAPRYMETAITSAPGGSGISPPLILAPRQEVASVPYAITAMSAPAPPAALPSAKAWSSTRTRGYATVTHADSDAMPTSWAVVPGLSQSIALDRPATVHLIASGVATGGNCDLGLRFKVAGNARGSTSWGQHHVSNQDSTNVGDGSSFWGEWTLIGSESLAAGTYSIELEMKTGASGSRCRTVCADKDGSMSNGSECTMLIQAFYD